MAVGGDMTRGITIILLVIFCLLEYRFWFSKDSILEVAKLKRSLAAQLDENVALHERNAAVSKKIANLKKTPLAIEEQARYELGMIKRGEKYYQIVEPVE